MSPIELFQEGRLREAIQEQDRFVQLHPDDAAGRLLLCELLLYEGRHDAIREHLKRIHIRSAGMENYFSTYRSLLDAADRRQRILTESDSEEPRFLMEPPPHLLKSVEALQALREGNTGECLTLLDKADALFAGVHGHIDGREFIGARDGDDLLSYALEVLIDGQYAWFPFDQIDRLQLGPIDNLRDRIYVPANLRATNGDEWQVHLPALYPGTHRHDDEEVKAGQATDWYSQDDGPIRGVGLRVFNFGEEELTLLDFTLWEG